MVNVHSFLRIGDIVMALYERYYYEARVIWIMDGNVGVIFTHDNVKTWFDLVANPEGIQVPTGTVTGTTADRLGPNTRVRAFFPSPLINKIRDESWTTKNLNNNRPGF